MPNIQTNKQTDKQTQVHRGPYVIYTRTDILLK